jgi:peptidoglycan hydrolase CwlO-like protein
MQFDINLLTIIIGAASALTAYIAAILKTKIDGQRQKVDELKSFGEANRLFRDEIRADLKVAHARITELEKVIKEKDNYIMQMHDEIKSMREKLNDIKS